MKFSFDKRTDLAAIHKLHLGAVARVPDLKDAKILEDWAGLRPAPQTISPSSEKLQRPVSTPPPATFRDGILLAPITAKIMAELISGKNPHQDLKPFSPHRFP